MKRPKTRIEKFLSLNQRRRRRGAESHLAGAPDYGALKNTRMPTFDRPIMPGSAKSLDAHFENLQRDFSGQSELLFYHAKLIVMIRRGYKTGETYARFEGLWDAEAEFLSDNLNTRWLISASDTFADHASDLASRAVAMLGSCLANTVKLYESEIALRNGYASDLPENPEQPSAEAYAMLFDGLPRFNPGRDDTLRNQRWRLEEHFQHGSPGVVLAAIYDRLQTHETAYSRLRQLQENSYSW